MPKESVQAFALTVTRGIGSPTSIVIHSCLFLVSFLAAILGWIEWDKMLLILTTIVSLEAIYLSIFIQMTINYTTKELEEVGDDIEEMQEDIGEIQEDVDEIQEDVDEIQEDVDEIQEDVEDISEEVEEMSEEDQKKAQNHAARSETLGTIQADLQKLLSSIERLKNNDKLQG